MPTNDPYHRNDVSYLGNTYSDVNAIAKQRKGFSKSNLTSLGAESTRRSERRDTKTNAQRTQQVRREIREATRTDRREGETKLKDMFGGIYDRAAKVDTKRRTGQISSSAKEAVKQQELDDRLRQRNRDLRQTRGTPARVGVRHTGRTDVINDDDDDSQSPETARAIRQYKVQQARSKQEREQQRAARRAGRN